MSTIYDEIEIEDFDFDPEMGMFYYPCPCGDRFQISQVSCFFGKSRKAEVYFLFLIE